MNHYITFSTVKALVDIKNNIEFINEEGVERYIENKKDSGTLKYDYLNAGNFFKDSPNFFENLEILFKTDELNILLELIKTVNPNWTRSIQSGRLAVIEKINEENEKDNLLQIIDELNLEDDVDDEIAKWWAYLEFSFNNDETFNKKELGLAGERLSKKYEIQQLSKLNINEGINDASINNPSAGYDLQSWRKGTQNKAHHIYIESKLNSQGYKNFYLSRNEFDKCIELKSKYFLYLWVLEDRDLINHICSCLDENCNRCIEIVTQGPYIYQYEKLNDNTPDDKGGSTWKTTFIKFDD